MGVGDGFVVGTGFGRRGVGASVAFACLGQQRRLQLGVPALGLRCRA